ncbi:MAG: potassium channel protein [Acidobacteriales bacterium]|nr:potassium channel protein [Terriglobales bacterium]
MQSLFQDRSFRRLAIALMAVVVVALSGVLGFRLIEGWGWFDSFYMVVMTMTTVGYREVHDLSPAGRIFNIYVMAAGFGSVFFSITALTQTLMSLELQRILGRRKMERELRNISDHFIICGAGRVGHSAAREFARSNVPFVIIETQGPKVERENNHGWLTVQGDATQENVLKEAGIDRAKGLVAATTTDATNIYIVLTARGLKPGLKIIARASELDAEKHLKTAGADVVISPYFFAGHRIAQHFLRPNVVDFLDIAISREKHEEMVIEEIRVSDRSRLAGATIGNSFIHRDLGIMVLAIKREDGNPCFNPTANEPIRAGDNLIVMGEAAKMPKLESIAAARSA